MFTLSPLTFKFLPVVPVWVLLLRAKEINWSAGKGLTV